MDGYDAFSAGVEPGGLRNRNEIKVLIAFLLKNTERGLSRRQLMEVIQREGLANYFEASQALESLIEGGSVEVDKSDDDELLSLTAAGKTAANIEDELPRAVRDKALATAEELLKQERRMKETLVTISKRTGFAISTVSRVLNGQAEKYRISRKTVELILAEARRCDYTPSLLAKGLRMKRTNTLGLLIPQVSNPYFADIASAIIREARSHGYTVMVVDTMENEENEQEGIRTMLSRRVDGIVAVPCGRTPDHLEKVDRSVPVMLVDRSFERTSLPYVCTDNYRGGVEATRILLQRGHRRIACIQGVPHSMPNRRRVQGYLDALRQAGLQEEAIITGDAFSLENGYRQTKLAVAGPDRPTAIFALSNTILLGAVKAIRESGLRIPEDISVVSFDDNPYLDFLVPAITRIGQPVEEIGKTAVRLLLESIREEVCCRTQLQLPPERIVRDSVANPRTAK